MMPKTSNYHPNGTGLFIIKNINIQEGMIIFGIKMEEYSKYYKRDIKDMKEVSNIYK